MNNLMKRQKITKAHVMVNEIRKHVELSDKIAKAMGEVDRELFVPKGMLMSAYRLDALPIRGKQFISSPLTVAKMTKYLEPEGADTILEIGCGSGYQAAVLSKIVRRVLSIERIEKLLKEAKASFKAAGIINVMTKLDDGQAGWAEYAPFDRILFSASAKEIPLNLVEQLEDGGIMVLPLERGPRQVITKVVRRGSGYTTESLESCEFVPVLSGIDKD